MAKISDPELEREFILHELDEERLLWLGAHVSESEVDLQDTGRRLDALLTELHDVNGVLGQRPVIDHSHLSQLGQTVLGHGAA